MKVIVVMMAALVGSTAIATEVCVVSETYGSGGCAVYLTCSIQSESTSAQNDDGVCRLEKMALIKRLLDKTYVAAADGTYVKAN